MSAPVSNASSTGPRTFRAWSGPVVLVLTALAALFLLGDAVVRAGWGQALLLAPWVLLVVWVIYETSAVSSVRIDDDGVVVQNMLRRTSFGWGRVKDIDLRWQLVFSLDDGRDLACWGGPARARPRRRPDDEGATPTGLREFTEISDRRASAVVDGGPIQRGWDVPALIALAVIVVWAAVSVTIANS